LTKPRWVKAIRGEEEEGRRKSKKKKANPSTSFTIQMFVLA
jgi:hypothetical protein